MIQSIFQYKSSYVLYNILQTLQKQYNLPPGDVIDFLLAVELLVEEEDEEIDVDLGSAEHVHHCGALIL